MADRDVAITGEDVCVDDESEEEGEVLDFEGQGLTSIQLPDNANPRTLILNNNDLTKIDGLDEYPGLSQLSAANNHIVHMTGLHMLTSLTVLSLSNNSIGVIEELEGLSQLMWLDLSSNSIKVIESLPEGGELHYLDLSDNNITNISDLSTLTNLKTLLLHSNNISSLKPAATCLPQNLGVLSLAGNNICDLNEISYLSSLHDLQQLSLAENPCVLKTSDSRVFDYRSFVWNWCPSLHILDALVINEKERLLGEWLYSQGKGRHFQPGEHVQLVDYLVTVCPLTSTEQLRPAEDNKLSQVLSQQRRYQQQLQQQQQQQQQPHHRQHEQQHIQTVSDLLSPHATSLYSVRQTETHTQDRNSTPLSLESSSEHPEPKSVWAKPTDQSALSHCSSSPHAVFTSDLILQDVSYDCDTRSSVSLLESESVYLPFDVPASPIVLRCSLSAPEKLSHSSANSEVTVAAAEKTGDLGTYQTRPLTDSSDRKYYSPEQRPIRPLNQLICRGVQRSSLHMTRPMTSSSEPRVSTHKDTMLLTARSQDYESGSEQTASESEGVPLDKSHAARPSVNTVMGSPTKPAPKDKLSHIRAVAGNKKVASQTTFEVQKKEQAAAKVRGGANLIMKTLFINNTTTSTTNTASTIAATALARARSLKISSVTSDRDITEANIPAKNSTKLDRPDHTGTSDSKLIKGKLNQERMEQNQNSSSSAIVNKAAATIQARWRGYSTRQFNAQVVSVRKEIRSRRAEDHIMLLRQDLERNRRLYEEEKQLRVLQMEAIRLLYSEVQELKAHSLVSSKEVHDADDYTSGSTANTTIRLNSVITTTAAVSPSAASYGELNRTQELEKTCVSLQSQVSQLQDALESVSSAVFKTNSLDSASFDIADHSDKVLVTPISDSQFCKDYHSEEISQWGCIPHSLSPYPSEEEDVYYLQVSTQGAPTPPRYLQLRHESHQALMLSWQVPSCCGQNWEEDGNKHIIGYRVYVNDQLKAFVCQKTSVLVEGLNPSTVYKFYVKALSGLGESFESNIIVAKLAKGHERPKFQAISGTDSSQDTDKDVDDTVGTNEKLKCRNKKLRKSSRSVEKMRGNKVSTHHHKRHQEVSSGLSEEASANMNISNNCTTDNAAFAILTHPKLHTHRRHRSKDRHSQQSKYYQSETTSQESSPCAGTVLETDGKKSEETLSNPQVSFMPPPFLPNSTRNVNSRRLLEFSRVEQRREDDVLFVENQSKASYKPTSESLTTHKMDSSSRITESPPTGSRKQSPFDHKKTEDIQKDKVQKQSPHASPVSGSVNENRQKSSQHVSPISSSANEIRQRPSPYVSPASGSANEIRQRPFPYVSPASGSENEIRQRPSPYVSPASGSENEIRQRPSPYVSPASGSENEIRQRPSPYVSPASGSANEIRQRPSPYVSPASGSENEIKQKHSPKCGQENLSLKMSPSGGGSNKSDSQPSSFSETFTVDKAHSYLESVSAIAQSVLRDRSIGKSGSHGHKQARGYDHQQQGSKAFISADGTVSLEQEPDCLSLEEATRLGIGRNREKCASSANNRKIYSGEADGSERYDSAEKAKGYRRSRNKDIGLHINDSSRDDAGGEMEENRRDNQVNKISDDPSRTDNGAGPQSQSEVKGGAVTLSSQPVIDGRRRHSSGSRPNSPVVSVGGGEKSRMTVAEIMMEQKLKGLTKSISLNSSSGRTEDSGSRSENSRRSLSIEPLSSSSQGDATQVSDCHLLEGGSKGESSKRTHSTESLMSTLTESSKRSHSNESLPGSVSVKTDTSQRSHSNESLPESIPEETEKSSVSQPDKNLVDQSSVCEIQASGCKRSRSMGSANDLSRKGSRDSHSSRTNSLVSKLLLKLESITRNSSTGLREKNDAFKLKKSNSDEREYDERDCDARVSKPPLDDERRSGRRSRNLSDSDAEGRTSDPGSQIPPRVPSDNSSGSHSDDNQQSRTRHRKTLSDHRPLDSIRPMHSPIIMEGGMIRKASSSVRRNQSFHGLLPSKHQDAKTSNLSNEEGGARTDEQTTNLPETDSTACPTSHMRSRTPSPSRGRKPVLSAAQLKCPTDASKP